MTAEERRAEIVEAAARAIVAHGVAGFRLRDVADEAGVSQPLVSSHFRSRDELVHAAFVQADERAMAIIERRSAAAPDARPALRTELLGALDDEGDPVVAQSFKLWHELWTHGSVVAELREAVQERQRVWLARIAELLRAGVEDGSVRATVDVDRTAMLLNTLLDGLAPALRWQMLELDEAAALIDDVLAERVDPQG